MEIGCLGTWRLELPTPNLGSMNTPKACPTCNLAMSPRLPPEGPLGWPSLKWCSAWNWENCNGHTKCTGAKGENERTAADTSWQSTELEQNEAAEQGSPQGWSGRTGTVHTLFTGNTVGGWSSLGARAIGARRKKRAAYPPMVSVTGAANVTEAGVPKRP